MPPILTSLLAGHAGASAASLFGSNPLVRLGAAGLATRIVAASLPLGIALIGGAALWGRHRRSEQARKAGLASARARRKTASPKRTANRTKAPKVSAKPAAA